MPYLRLEKLWKSGDEEKSRWGYNMEKTVLQL
jgi:hypothetical protein